MARSEQDEAADQNGRKPLLELSTLAPERPYITIDGQRYEMALPEDFGLVEQATLERIQRQAMTAKADIDKDPDSVSEAQAAHLSDLLRQLVAMGLPSLPDAVADRLSDGMRYRIIQVFQKAVGQPTPQNRKARRRTGARSSRGSSASTGDAPATG